MIIQYDIAIKVSELKEAFDTDVFSLPMASQLGFLVDRYATANSTQSVTLSAVNSVRKRI